MAHIGFHPAPGLGDLLPGEFVVPQNPIRDAGTPLVPSAVAVMGGRPYKIPHIGDLLPGKFVVPQNPLVNTLVNGYSGMPQAKSAGGCGCAGGCSHGGMGDLTAVTTWLQTSSVAGLPNWVLVAGGAAIAYMIFMPGGSEYRKKSAALRSQYRGYRRASRAAGSTLQEV